MKPARNARCDPHAAREELRNDIAACGFHRVGFADARADPGAEELREWIARGYHGDMDYLARTAERRCRVQEVLRGARAVIAVAVDYRPAAAFGIASPRSDAAEISAYARGTDYHRVLEKRLRETCRLLASRFPAERFRYYTDTGPVLEKAWAERAGLGWIGKNTCLIDKDNGSFFFLGIILTTLEVAADAPFTDHCGSCRLCIDACPTDALVAPYVLDARRCISYLTIETQEPIGAPLENRMENLVFGCDICQEVCPWNRSDREGADPELAPRPENVFPPLEDLARLDPETFRERFPKSPVRRARFRGFLRNVLVALGNAQRPEHLDLLEDLAGKDYVRTDPLLRDTLERARRKVLRRNRAEETLCARRKPGKRAPDRR